MIDVTIHHEDGGNLQMGRSKIEKYAPLLPDLQHRYSLGNREILPIVTGTGDGRASLKQTVEVLDMLIKGKNDLLTISLMSFRRSVQIYNHFMDFNAPIG
jgi:hypothetical protein